MRRLLLLVLCVALVASAPWGGGSDTHAASTDFELRVLGYNSWVSGGPGSLRVIAYHPQSLRGVGGIPVEAVLDLGGKKEPLPLFKGTTNEQGSLDGQFRIPGTLEGAVTLRVSAAAPAEAKGRHSVDAAIQVRREQRIYLTTDKPLYQPGQDIHVRALVLRSPGLEPLVKSPLTIEIEDARANKVYKHRAVTSRFGVVSTTFRLASEVNMGEYHVRCRLGDENGATAEKSVTVKKYVLPKFKIGIKTDKSWYLPKEKVRGTVQADYFFGKPVAGARVAVEVRTFDVDVRSLARLEGVTGPTGSYAFEFELPDYFVGQPLEKGKATLGFAVQVKDTADHQEEGGTQVAVVKSPIAVEVIPESGHLVPGLPNKLFFLSTLPDGSPVSAALRINLPHYTTALVTDATGFGEVSWTPAPPDLKTAHVSQYAVPGRRRFRGDDMPLGDVQPGLGPQVVPTIPVQGTVVVRDRSGTEATVPVSLGLAAQRESILVRPDRALYRVGDVFKARIFSSKKNGNVYVDMIRDNQTIFTRSVDVKDGEGDLSFSLTPETFGAIQVHAYEIRSTGDIVRDTRRIFVQPAKDLLVTVQADRGTYRPGGESKLTFMVKDSKGVPALAVLGVDVVDESLFALAERQPGLERVYFLLERQLMASRYEVHGLSLQDAVRDQKKVDDERSQRYSQALFTRMPAPGAYTLKIDTFETKLSRMVDRMFRVQQAVYVYRNKHGSWPDSVKAMVEAGVVSQADSLDAWGHPLRLQRKNGTPVVCSLGPDGRYGSGDEWDYQTLAHRYRRGPQGGDLDDELGAVRGGMARPQLAAAKAAPAATGVAMERARRDENEARPADTGSRDVDRAGAKGQPAPRIREFFPETLFVAPEVVTDEKGRATLTIPLADSITTWRLTAFASSVLGKMGNATAGIRVFQDFFVDIDAPVSLTQGDVVSIPVAVYNYLPEAQTVSLRLEKADWYEQMDGDTREIKMGPNEVTGVSFQIRAKSPGSFPLTVFAQGSKLSDAIRRSIAVMPDGREFTSVKSDQLRGTVKAVVDVPADAIDGASKMLVTLYPGVFSQVVEGLDSILRMPGGCFEQTSSSTYPNVLVTRYLKRMRKTTPELSMKAEGYINAGYQRLLTFEVPGGGFSVFGQAPANPILTAYGLMEFHDMAKVHEVDPNLLARTRQWLLAQQGKDGAWGAGRQGFYAEGWSNVPNSNLVSTAYIAWALVECGERDARVTAAVNYLRKHMHEASEPYTAALVANTLVAWDPKDAAAAEAVDRLLAMRIDDKDYTYWRTKIATAAYGTGRAGDIETTALATLALLGSGQHSAQANRALAYLVRSKDAFGTWQSTQATVLTMKALIASIERAGDQVNANVSVLVNGKKAGSFRMTSDNFDVFHQVDVSGFVQKGANEVVLTVEGKGNALYKIATHVWRPWKAVPPPPSDILSIDVQYDRSTLAKDDTAACSVQVRNLTKRVANQVMLDIGVPPGFDVRSDDLEALVKKQVIQRFSLTGRQVIIYLAKMDAAQALTVTYRLKARYPLRAQAPASRVYEYYNPDRQAITLPKLMEVK